ncbi:hypothetical protein K493DRAFT_302255 [Basidiobolus meristosporus CBS 931.73]|uniref:Uncharacterized protein n=1 Tax=Basidiobolus meristosporus CBS 931.73 TaxID=1314790 RepID=A0A1Y1Y995_9FUNG|nr:hypothetical protein K493DRAFT_302255 [Basidiobolus meristosporus CBS 931.73]|eukprot:ORX94134.1 hypothetical protein K493DRAFT_302255 [Basidiobolus meristosporus CBS 931.73]
MPDKKSPSKRKELSEPTEVDSEHSPKKSRTETLPQLEAFLKMAKPLKVQISHDDEDTKENDEAIISLTAKPTKMSTGSYGWSTTGKAKVKCNCEEVVPVQISINIVVPGSKNMTSETEKDDE